MQIIHNTTENGVGYLVEARDCPEQKRLLFRASHAGGSTGPGKSGFTISYEHLREVLQALHQGRPHTSLQGCPAWARRHVLRFLTSRQESPVMEQSLSYQLDTILEKLDASERLSKEPTIFDGFQIIAASFSRGISSVVGFGARVAKTALIILLTLGVLAGIGGAGLYVVAPESFAFSATITGCMDIPVNDDGDTNPVYTVDLEPTLLSRFWAGAETRQFIDTGENGWYTYPEILEVSGLSQTILEEAEMSYWERMGVLNSLEGQPSETEESDEPVESEGTTQEDPGQDQEMTGE